MNAAEPMENPSAVHRYLKALGYRVSQRTVYYRCKAGEIGRGSDGVYDPSVVRAWADTHFPRTPASGEAAVQQAQAEEARGVASEKTAAEIERIRWQAEREKMKALKEKGELVPRSEVVPMLVGRALSLDAALSQAIELRAAEIVELAGGKAGQVPEVRRLLLDLKDGVLAEYVRMDKAEVDLEDAA